MNGEGARTPTTVGQGGRDTVQLEAPAKINLGLWVGKRDDQGYHPIDTVMHSIRLADRLTVGAADTFRLIGSEEQVPLDEGHSLRRAARLLSDILRRPVAWVVRLVKHIPVGGGLGGSGTDAAALLRWAAAAYPEAAGDIRARASELGMDVPFLLDGGAARATGRGERLMPLPPLAGRPVVLLSPGFGVETRAVYAAFDDLGQNGPNVIAEIAQALTEGRLPSQWANHLEAAAWRVRPGLKDFYQHIARVAYPRPCVLSGSGSTYYVIGPDLEEASALAYRMRQEGVPWVAVTELTGGSVRAEVRHGVTGDRSDRRSAGGGAGGTAGSGTLAP